MTSSFHIENSSGQLNFNAHAGSVVTKHLSVQNLDSSLLALSLALSGSNQFALVGLPAMTVTGNGTGDITLTYSPLTTGNATGYLTVRATNGDTAQIQLNGQAIQSGLDRLSVPSDLNFNAQVGQQQCLPLNIGNITLGTVTVSNVAITGGNNQFTTTNTGSTDINSGNTGSINVCYMPVTAGVNSNGTLTFTYTSLLDSSFHGTRTVQLNGTASGSANTTDSLFFYVTPTLQFVDVTVGQTSCQAIRITNPSAQAITIDSASFMGSNAGSYDINGATNLQVAGGTTQYVNVCFTPDVAGVTNGTVGLNYTVNVNGIPLHGTLYTSVTGIATAIDTTTTNVACILARRATGVIGPVVTGGNTSGQVYLTNTTANPITVTGATVSGTDASAFNVGATQFPMTINSGSTGTLNVNFTPTNTTATSAVNYQSTVQLATTGGNNCGPVTINLTGISVPAYGLDTTKLTLGGGANGGGSNTIGIVNSGTSACMVDTVTFYNTSNTSVNIVGLMLGNTSNFTILGTNLGTTFPISVASNGSLQTYIQFCANGQTNQVLTSQLYVMTDQSIQPQTYQVQGIQLAPSAVRTEISGRSIEFAVMPNPTAGRVTISIDGARSSKVEVYDILGTKLASMNGTSSITWEGRDQAGSQLANGSYIVRVSGIDENGEAFTASKHVVIQH